jgi:SpoIID/LytB domain protein
MVTHMNTRKRVGLLTVLIAMTAVTLVAVGSTPSAVAGEDDNIVVNGAGWGHGVGMSQFGAYGMAVEGSSYDDILEHFYTNASLGTLGQGGLDAPGNLWVNLELDFSTLELRVDAISGAGEPVLVTRSAESWEVPVGSTIEIRGPENCSLLIDPPGADNAYETPSGTCSFDMTWYDFANPDADPLTKIAIVGCTQTDWNVVPSLQRECQYGRGMLHVRSGSGGLDLSAEMLLDDYILGISEMPYFWGVDGMEALKAQAVAARSYARELQIYRGTPGANSCGAWCHVRDTTFDQRYVGWGHGAADWITATTSTASQVMTHPDAPNDNIVRTYYSSSTGGRTESIQEVWSGWDAREYYQGVDDRWSVDGTVYNPSGSWSVTLTNAAVASAVGLPTVTDAWVSERNSSGSADTVIFTDGATTVSKASSWMKSTFGLKSIYFDVGLAAGSTATASVFIDTAGNVHEPAIEQIYDRGVTKGCNPPTNNKYCPANTLTRAQLAAFLVRAFELPATTDDFFTDDEGSIFENDINRLAASGITLGCGDNRYCPSSPVTREQMAAFVDRAFGYTAGTNVDVFTDDDGSPFEASINRIAAAGVTFGCNPPENSLFCPKDPVRRDQMASFIDRALDGAGK